MELISKRVLKYVSKLIKKFKSLTKPYQMIPLALAVVLVLLVIVGLSRCSSAAPVEDVFTCVVATDNLEVHKKSSATSRVLSQLPLDQEIEVLELKSVDGTDWGRIDKMTLADGTKIKAGWIDLQYIRLPGEVEETEPVVDPTEPQETTPPVLVNMGTITAGKLNVRKGPDSKYETSGAYINGDRVEILETQTIDGTRWGRTNLGWIGMGYVRMDGEESTENDPNKNPQLVTNGSTTVMGYGVVNLGELNVRLGPDTEYGKVNTVKMGKRYAYYQLSEEGWARIDGGWVSTEHFYIEGTTASTAMTGVVNTADLNIRTGPDTSFQSVGTYQQGETIEVLGQVNYWGYTNKGWVFMNYVSKPERVYKTGICKVTSPRLNIRKEPNAESESVGAYSAGDGVNILEVQENWGRTIQGWINLNFVEYEDQSHG